jgi:hypothetical protein
VGRGGGGGGGPPGPAVDGGVFVKIYVNKKAGEQASVRNASSRKWCHNGGHGPCPRSVPSIIRKWTRYYLLVKDPMAA